MHELIAILDFGSQYTQVIGRRLRELNVYSKIYPYTTSAQQLTELGIKGLILSGGPASVLAEGSPRPDPELFKLDVPILGVCYGLQLMAHLLGGEVGPGHAREYGLGHLELHKPCSLLDGVKTGQRVWNSHGDHLVALPTDFEVMATTENAPYAVIAHKTSPWYGLQFHPEVAHTEPGQLILKNFAYGICGCRGDWVMADYIDESVEQIRKTVGSERVVLGLSGGVDSSVAAALIHKAIGDQLTCIFVDHGLLRLHEREQVEALFRSHFKIDLRVIDASSIFLSALAGVEDPEHKRKIIGKLFVETFEAAIKDLGSVKFLAQGTLYPDVIESVSINGNPSATIKTHHNVGGLPEGMRFELLEPFRELFKDEVRAIGTKLGLPDEMVHRHPFPGPGLAIRIMGAVNLERLDWVRRSDAIFMEELRNAGLYRKIWQAFTVFLPVRTVGVMGDERTHDYVLALRAVESQDAMTADWSKIPYEVLQKTSSRIVNEVRGINRVVYDITSKPPGTIEWE
ncbi:MAG: GMP synthase (glutamine-hydrolyzing) [Verrucomicrobia bacterium 21-51-4]|nr:MAG: GMP synthase (glutamine-hydrolyzing) [Verrucomicrobia bacterium 21-51-4]HQU08472.1 glutamine-hydrolyzing GMP synthase [Opitutales bacterium]